jgi:hypothetical protein
MIWMNFVWIIYLSRIWISEWSMWLLLSMYLDELM